MSMSMLIELVDEAIAADVDVEDISIDIDMPSIVMEVVGEETMKVYLLLRAALMRPRYHGGGTCVRQQPQPDKHSQAVCGGGAAGLLESNGRVDSLRQVKIQQYSCGEGYIALTGTQR